MHAVKIGWVGQTFALAKSNESEGKKSRIRRSKEDRKAMVESFIKRYQDSNKGSFPSINLTQKEIGGSFYTVREIVREIIQENRVLGPAKPTEGEQEVDQFYEQYPLGSISIECQSHVSLPSTETHAASRGDHIISKDSPLNGKVSDQELQRRDSEQYINGILVDGQYKEADASKPLVQGNHAMLHTDILINQNSGSMGDIMKISTPRVTPLATDIWVETFPMNSPSKTAQEIDGRSVEAEKSAVSLEQHEINRVEVKPEPSESGVVLDQKSPEHLTDQLCDKNLHRDAASSDDLVLKTMDQDDLLLKTKDQGDLEMNTIDQDLVAAEKETKPAPKDTHSKKSDHIGSNQGASLSQGVAATKSENPNTFSKEEGKTSTLNRTKLESWEGPARKSAEAEINSVLAVFKAFISAFVKFWTEE